MHTEVRWVSVRLRRELHAAPRIILAVFENAGDDDDDDRNHSGMGYLPFMEPFPRAGQRPTLGYSRGPIRGP